MGITAGLLASVLFFFIALADLSLSSGDTELNIGGTILNIDRDSTIDNIAFETNNFTVTMSGSQNFYFSSNERKAFDISTLSASNLDYVKRSCDSSKSGMSIETPSGLSSTNYTITIKSTICGGSDGGGGGGGGGEPPPPPPPPPPLPPPPKTLKKNVSGWGWSEKIQWVSFNCDDLSKINGKFCN